jgi:predicted nucleic acid-binding protein
LTFYFLESSALAKLFVQEEGSDALIRLVEHLDDSRKVFSSLAPLEVRSAIRRRQRAGEILPADADYALDSVSAEVVRMVEQPLSPSVIETARNVLDHHPLRAMDALHLATAMVARDTLQATDICFVSSDEALLDAAEAERFEVLDPLEM